MKKEFTPYFCDDSIVDVVLPADRIELDETKEWLIIGWPGFDGIQFRVKLKGADQTVYTFYPIEQEYIKIADSDKDLIEKWKSGQVSV